MCCPQPDAQKASLHNKWCHQIAFSGITEDFSDEMLAMVKNAPKMGTPEFLAMFPYDGAKRLYAEIEDNVRTDLEGSTGVAHDHEANELVLKIDGLESDLADLRGKLQQAEEASGKLTADAAAFKVQLADAAKALAAEQEKSASLWDSLRKAQEEVSRSEPEADSLIRRMEHVEMQFRDIRRNFAPVAGKGKEAMSPTGKVAPIPLDKGGMRKKRSADVLSGTSSSSTARKGSLFKTHTRGLGKDEWGLRTDLLLTEMNYPNKGDVRNLDILEAFKQQLGRNLSAAELRVITHHNGPLLKVKSAVYVGSAVSRKCRNDTDWYLQFHTFFLRFFQTLRKAYDDVSTEYAMAVADERTAFKADMMARFEDEIYGPGKAPMAKKLFELVAQNPGTGVNVTMIKRSLTNHWHAKPGKWLTYDVELLGKETPLVLTAGASSVAGAAEKTEETEKTEKTEKTTKKAKVLASQASDAAGFSNELSQVLIDMGPMEGEPAGQETGAADTSDSSSDSSE